VTSPSEGATFSCAGTPPEIVWTPKDYRRFQVFLSWTGEFRSGSLVKSDRLEGKTSWRVPAADWKAACGKANGSLRLKVAGAVPKTKSASFSNTVTIKVR